MNLMTAEYTHVENFGLLNGKSSKTKRDANNNNTKNVWKLFTKKLNEWCRDMVFKEA